VRIDQFDGIARSIADGWPGKAKLIIYFVLKLACSIQERQLLATARKAGTAIRVERPERACYAKLRLKGRGILRHHQITSCRDADGGKHVRKPGRKPPATETHR